MLSFVLSGEKENAVRYDCFRAASWCVSDLKTHETLVHPQF